MDYNSIAQTCALAAIAAGLWRKIDRTVTVNVPDVNVPSPVPSQIKIVMPADIQKATTEAHLVDIGQVQPDGSVQWVGIQTVMDPYDRSTWPARLEFELSQPGRVLRLPNGTIDEGVQCPDRQ